MNPKLIVLAAADAGVGRSLCAANIAISLSRRARCLAVEVEPSPGKLRAYTRNSVPTDSLNPEALLQSWRLRPVDYVIATLPLGEAPTTIELFRAADVPIIVTHSASESLERVVDFLGRCEARHVYIILNKVQRAGEERAAAAAVRKASAGLGFEIDILGTIPFEPEPGRLIATAFEDLSFKIERREAAPVEEKSKPSRKPRTKTSPVTIKVEEDVRRLESMLLIQANEIKRLQDAVVRRGRTRFPIGPYIVGGLGVSLALAALVGARPQQVQIFSEPATTPVVQAAPPPQPETRPAPVLAPDPAAVKNPVVRQVVPEVPQSAKETIKGTIRVTVRVKVDGSGSVTDATLESAGPSRYFASLATAAARDWKFIPTKASSEWLLQFEFGSVSTNAYILAASNEPQTASR